MNITFLVGNGFDVATGLHTGYKDFYDWYCNLPASENEDSSLQKFKQSIHEYVERVKEKKEKKQETWADFELGLGEYTEQFEKEQGNDFLLCREDALNKLILYLTQEQEGFDTNSLLEKDIERIKKQLGNFYSPLPTTEREQIEQVFHSLQNQNASIKFISFNYTTILDAIVERISKSPIRTWSYGTSKLSYYVDPQVLHTHGKLDEYPILGVHSESQIKNKDLLTTVGFKESMVKYAGVNALGRDWYRKAEQIIDNSSIICIFGMSLGATDRKWWIRIIDWLSKNNLRRLGRI